LELTFLPSSRLLIPIILSRSAVDGLCRGCRLPLSV
jgi:hypothetical protein